MLITIHIPKFIKLPFFLSWWAYSFPLASITIASVVKYHTTHAIFYQNLAYILFTILSVVIAILIGLTLKTIWRGQICVEE
jgi:tellurite resistance protein